MNNPAPLHQPLMEIYSHFQNKRDPSHGKDLLHFHMCTLHSHFQLTHLNFSTHSHTDIVSYINLAYCNEIFAFFLSFSFFNLISLHKLHFHNISGMLKCPSVTGGELEVHKIKQFAKCHTRSQWQSQRQAEGFTILLLGSLQKHSFSATEAQTVYEKGKEYQQI